MLIGIKEDISGDNQDIVYEILRYRYIHNLHDSNVKERTEK